MNVINKCIILVELNVLLNLVERLIWYGLKLFKRIVLIEKFIGLGCWNVFEGSDILIYKWYRRVLRIRW